MMRPAVLLCVVAAPAMAADNLVAEWGAGDRSAVILAPADGPHIATITRVNRLTGGAPDVNHNVLTLGDLSVSVINDDAPGDLPDTIRVTVPEGYIAVPDTMTVPEGESGTILIYEADALILG